MRAALSLARTAAHAAMAHSEGSTRINPMIVFGVVAMLLVVYLFVDSRMYSAPELVVCRNILIFLDIRFRVREIPCISLSAVPSKILLTQQGWICEWV
jgi:hypothetical protein